MHNARRSGQSRALVLVFALYGIAVCAQERALPLPSLRSGLTFAGPDILRLASEGKSYLALHAPQAVSRDFTHVVWATGGSLLPDAEYEAYRVEGQKHAALRINGKQGPLAGTRDER